MIDVEVRNGIGLGGIEGGCLVEVEEGIGVAGRFVGRRGGGKSEVAEDAGEEVICTCPGVGILGGRRYIGDAGDDQTLV